MTDAFVTAAAVVSDPRRLSTVAHRDLLAICRELVLSDGRSQITDGLAAAARALFVAEATHTLSKGADGYAPLPIGLAREQAFLAFKRIFEEEFPNA